MTQPQRTVGPPLELIGLHKSYREGDRLHTVLDGATANIAAGERVPWRKIYRVPDHVYFSHRRHASIAAIECEVCHGPVAEQVTPAGRPHWRPTMNNCMECHEETGASNDCVHCHY